MKEVITKAIKLVAPYNNKKVLAQTTYTISNGYQKAYSCSNIGCYAETINRLKNPKYVQAISDKCYCGLFLFTIIESVEQDLSELNPLCSTA